jgi:hypothetical protein
MYCPNCSTQAAEGAKFCKSCGLNLTVIAQALSGDLALADPIRDREYRRVRKQISDAIHGLAIGVALLVAGALAYFLLPKDKLGYVIALIFGLAGVIKLFRSIGHIVDAKMGPALVEPTWQRRGADVATSRLSTTRLSRRLQTGTLSAQVEARMPAGLAEKNQLAPLQGTERPAGNMTRPATGHINREQSSPLRKLEDDNLMSKLRN